MVFDLQKSLSNRRERVFQQNRPQAARRHRLPIRLNAVIQCLRKWRLFSPRGLWQSRQYRPARTPRPCHRPRAPEIPIEPTSSLPAKIGSPPWSRLLQPGEVIHRMVRFGPRFDSAGCPHNGRFQLHRTRAHPSTSCWPPSMSKVAPVTAVFVMRWTASAAMSAGPTTRRIGRFVRSCSRRVSS
jgi:hypothetical protein